MEPEVQFIDPEFQTSSDKPIDYKLILFKQIDYIRYLRTQDMGEFTILDFDVVPKDETFLIWFGRSSTYQNSVKALQSLLKNYNDVKFETNITAIDVKYTLLLKTELDKVKKQYSNFKTLYTHQQKEKANKIKHIKRIFSLKEIPSKYDEIFEECLKLMERAKYIGGNDGIIDTM